MLVNTNAISILACSLLLAGLGGVRSALAQAAPEDPVDRELRFASGLVDQGLPNYAEKILEILLSHHPEAKARAGAVRIKIFTAGGKFDKAEELIKTLPPDSLETLVMTLTLGDKYYEWGKMKEARGIYDAFFKRYPQGPSGELAKFYMESAYKYVQMLTYMGDQKAALQAYEYVLLAKPEKDIDRRLRIEMAELALKLGQKATGAEQAAYFKRTKDLCATVQWGGHDLWFGRSVVLLCHIDLIQGNREGAQKTINEFMPMLQDVDNGLREQNEPMKFSPMAECRYMLGVSYQEEGQALLDAGSDPEAIEKFKQALNHLYNVFVKYPTSGWAPEAGQRADQLKNMLIARGHKVRMPTVDMRPIVDAQLKEAKLLFRQQDWEGAAGTFVKVLNLFPEQDGSPTALGELAQCYIYLKNPAYARAVMGHLAERFSRNERLREEAGNAVIAVAEGCESINDQEMATRAYDLFFASFPGHARVPSLLFRFGETKFREENYDLALGYYQQIATNYTKSAVYVAALSRTAYSYALMKDYTNAAAAFTRYAAEAQPGPGLIDGIYRLGDAWQQMGRYVAAINEYSKVVQLLAADERKYAPMAEDVARNRAVLEKAMFWKAYCYAKLRDPPDKQQAYRDKAIADYDAFLKAFPKADRAAFALSRMGVLLQVSGRSDEATTVFDRLSREYPSSDEAKDVVFMRGMGLIELGQMDKAVGVFEQMFANKRAFTAAQFLRVGKIMAEAGQPATAIRFFQEVRGQSQQRDVWEPATLAIGQAYLAQTNHADGARLIEELLAKYPNTGYMVDSGFVLCQAYIALAQAERDPGRRTELLDKAIRSVKKVRTYSKEADIRARSDIQVAEIEQLGGNAESAVASYTRLLLLADANNPKVRPYIEQAFERSIPLLLGIQRHRDVIENCGIYLDAFPRGRLVNQARGWRDSARLKVAAEDASVGGAISGVATNR